MLALWSEGNYLLRLHAAVPRARRSARGLGRDEAAHFAGEQRELLGAMIDGIGLHALPYPDRLPPKKQAAVMEFVLQLLK